MSVHLVGACLQMLENLNSVNDHCEGRCRICSRLALSAIEASASCARNHPDGVDPLKARRDRFHVFVESGDTSEALDP